MITIKPHPLDIRNIKRLSLSYQALCSKTLLGSERKRLPNCGLEDSSLSAILAWLFLTSYTSLHDWKIADQTARAHSYIFLSDGRQPEVAILHHWVVFWLKLSGKSSF